MDCAAKTFVFISYARKDGTDLAYRLRRDLEGNGYRAWLDACEIHGGVTWTSSQYNATEGRR